MGLRTSRSAEIAFTDCEVPEGNRLGEEGQGLKIALELLDGGRVGIAAQAVGIAQGALEASVAYAKQRRAFGKTIGDFQAVQWMLADMQTEIEAARGLMHHAAWMRDTGAPRLGAYASRAKLYAGQARLLLPKIAISNPRNNPSHGASKRDVFANIVQDRLLRLPTSRASSWLTSRCSRSLAGIGPVREMSPSIWPVTG